MKRTAWIFDTQRLVPVRLTKTYYRDRAALSGEGTVQLTERYTWTMRDGIYLIESIEGEAVQPGEDRQGNYGPEMNLYKARFQWDTVNADIDPQMFQPDILRDETLFTSMIDLEP